MSCRIIVALDAAEGHLLFRTAEGRWTPLRHEAATLPAATAERMARAIEDQDATVSVTYCLDADCVANRWQATEGREANQWAARAAVAPAFAPAAAWA